MFEGISFFKKYFPKKLSYDDFIEILPKRRCSHDLFVEIFF